jgi:hypothetical protein
MIVESEHITRCPCGECCGLYCNLYIVCNLEFVYLVVALLPVLGMGGDFTFTFLLWKREEGQGERGNYENSNFFSAKILMQAFTTSGSYITPLFCRISPSALSIPLAGR